MSFPRSFPILNLNTLESFVFEICCRQNNRQTDGLKCPTHAYQLSKNYITFQENNEIMNCLKVTKGCVLFTTVITTIIIIPHHCFSGRIWWLETTRSWRPRVHWQLRPSLLRQCQNCLWTSRRARPRLERAACSGRTTEHLTPQPTPPFHWYTGRDVQDRDGKEQNEN